MNIEESINQFLEGRGKNRGRKPDERYASFDYCYNYFYSFYKEKKLSELADEENLQASCLQLGFYLASWGMMRGSSFLLEKSVSNFKNLIITISEMDSKLWEIDADNYSEENISLLLNCKQQITNALGEHNKPSDTLVTKIMLGVFANVPAFDTFFSRSFKIWTFNKKSLLKINGFYNLNKKTIDSFKINTFNFSSSEETDIIYTKAKLIDMYGFMDGQ